MTPAELQAAALKAASTLSRAYTAAMSDLYLDHEGTLALTTGVKPSIPTLWQTLHFAAEISAAGSLLNQGVVIHKLTYDLFNAAARTAPPSPGVPPYTWADWFKYEAEVRKDLGDLLHYSIDSSPWKAAADAARATGATIASAASSAADAVNVGAWGADTKILVGLGLAALLALKFL